jgi:hypothetical protein
MKTITQKVTCGCFTSVQTSSTHPNKPHNGKRHGFADKFPHRKNVKGHEERNFKRSNTNRNNNATFEYNHSMEISLSHFIKDN